MENPINSGSQAWGGYLVDQATPPNITANLKMLPIGSVQAIVNTPFQGAMFSQRYGLISDQMSADIRGALTQSMINGESMDDAAARVQGVMGDPENGGVGGYQDRALTIARTEIMRAQNLGAWDSFENQNKDLMADEPDWFATADDRLCPKCYARDGKTKAEWLKSSLSGKYGKSFTMPLHPRCRCRWMPRLKTWKQLGVDLPEDLPDDARSLRNAEGKWEQVPVQTFDAWKAQRGIQLGVTS